MPVQPIIVQAPDKGVNDLLPANMINDRDGYRLFYEDEKKKNGEYFWAKKYGELEEENSALKQQIQTAGGDGYALAFYFSKGCASMTYAEAKAARDKKRSELC